MIAPGLRIGHYLIEKRLGAGGMGEVFRAFDEKLERPVAIKVLPQIMERNEDARARMLREARAASALVHPGIVTVHEVDEHEGRIFLVMEYVEGETFSQLVAKRGKLKPAEALKLIRPVASALEFAHKQGFVHRDIKCANLMVTTNGHVKVLDFGLSKRVRRDAAGASGDGGPPPADPDTVGIRKGVAARLAAAGGEAAAAPPDAATRPGSGVLAGRPPSMPSHDVDATGPTQASVKRPPPANDDLTVEGSAMGTPGYTALELMDGLEADARADVYSLGIVLYELLTATRPFTGATFATVREDVARERYRRAKELVPELSSELDAVINEALRADRDQRTPSVTAMLAHLAEASAAPRRRRRALYVIVAAALVAGGGWGILQLSRTRARTTAPGDGAVALPAADGGDGDAQGGDGAIATGPLAPVRITQLGGCAYAPAFLDDDTVAFDLTLPGGAPDIHLLSLGGGATRQLTSKPTWEWRSAPGAKPGEIVYLVSDMANSARSSLVARDIGAGEARDIAYGAMAAAAAARGAYYYIPANGTELRRLHDKVDQLVARLTGMSPQALSTSRDQRWIAIAGKTPSQPADVCLVDLDARGALRCLELVDPLAGRADFGIADTLYYGATDGIHARFPADGSASADRIAIPNVQAHGGVAVSPDGRALVYSACTPAGSLRDVGATPQVELTSGDNVSHPAVGPTGKVAWVENGNEVVVRFPDGQVGRVAGRGATGDTVANPSFDAEGDTVAFARSGGEPGIIAVDLTPGAELRRLTTQAGDDTPLFLANGTILFTRWSGATPSVYRIAPGADPAPARQNRRALGVDGANQRVLLLVPGAAELVWWDPATNAELPGPPARPPGLSEVRDISLSPNGAWLLYQGGPNGGELWELPLSDPRVVPAISQVYVAPAGATAGLSAVTDDGHPIIVEISWQGELWRLDAGNDPW